MMKRVVRQAAGWFFLVLGVIGLFLPILQGALFILVGVIILARDVPFFHKVHIKLEARYPALFARAKKIQLDIAEKFRKMAAGVTKWVKPGNCNRDRRTGPGE